MPGETGIGPVQVFTITLERISTGQTAPSLLHRAETEVEARAYAQLLIDGQRSLERPEGTPDLRIAEITSRPA